MKKSIIIIIAVLLSAVGIVYASPAFSREGIFYDYSKTTIRIDSIDYAYGESLVVKEIVNRGDSMFQTVSSLKAIRKGKKVLINHYGTHIDVIYFGVIE